MLGFAYLLLLAVNGIVELTRVITNFRWSRKKK